MTSASPILITGLNGSLAPRVAQAAQIRGHSFDRIVAALQAQYQRQHWQIRVHSDYVHDQRLVGGGRQLPRLSERLGSLRPM